MRESPPNFLPVYWDPAAPAPRFSMGKRVRVKELAPIGHYRAPHYVHGRSGVIERVCGHFHDPQELAYGRTDGPKLPLYRVRFALSDLFPEKGGYAREDTLDVELYESWLAPFFDYDDLPGESARLEAALRDGAAQESARQESAPQESARQESARQESAPKEDESHGA